MEKVYLNPDLTKEEFFEIINDLVKKYIHKQQQIIECKMAHSDKKIDEHSHDNSEESEEEEHDHGGHGDHHHGVSSGKSTPHNHAHSNDEMQKKAGTLKLVELAKSDFQMGAQQSSGQTTTLHIFQDYIKQNSFYRDLKRNKNSFLKDSEKHHVDFGNKCMDGNTLPIPTFANMINGKSVVLNNYPMEQYLVDALTQHIDSTCQLEAMRAIDNMIINSCGLNDS